jgi:hypothetical protein
MSRACLFFPLRCLLLFFFFFFVFVFFFMLTRYTHAPIFLSPRSFSSSSSSPTATELPEERPRGDEAAEASSEVQRYLQESSRVPPCDGPSEEILCAAGIRPQVLEKVLQR